eukprot:a174388_1457.p2 GENE.a174388_1457~~a174388_1457.p2  ORF type:complete len:202 (+),score=76.84 a174388_1457:38-607(+)
MVFVLLIGDAHVPHRAFDIPPPFRKLLLPGKIQHILCTGNLTSRDQLDYLRHLAADCHVVRGEHDEIAGLPESKVVQIGGFQIGVVHGHDVVPWGDHESLAMVARKLNCDILVSGHTHAFEAFEYEGKLFINPGSVTGAYSSITDDVQPSFVLMDVKGSSLTAYIYQLIDGELKVDKIQHPAPPAEDAE